MGGNALKHTGTRRYMDDEFQTLAKRIVPLIAKILDTEAELVKSYRNKESHGDMDILVLSNGNKNFNQIYSIIEEVFQPTDIVKNSNCWSFDYKKLQIDLILTPPENWETSKVFFSYNDLGNLMGKIFHKFGVKYGFDGLKYVVRSEDQSKRYGDITLTKDMKKAFEFIGLSWERFEEGFDDLTDIFDYVIGSPYFSADSFYLENLNAINKKRNKRRKVYGEFVEYVKDIKKSFEFKEKDTYLPILNSYFDDANLLETIEMYKEKEKKENARKAAFNGGLVMKEFPQLKGKELGNAINGFKAWITPRPSFTFENYLDVHIKNGVADIIMKDFSDYMKHEYNEE